jgi:hypothetical protein
MKPHCMSRLATIALICSLPLAAQSAGSQSANTDADMSAEELAAIADRMRETSEKMLADLKKARARFEARKNQIEVQRRQEAEAEAEQAKKVALVAPTKESRKLQTQPKETPAQSLARKEAEREQAEIRAMEERTAQAFAELKTIEEKRARAAKALAAARRQSGVKAFAESDE